MTAKPTARKRTVPHGKLTRLIAQWRRESNAYQFMLDTSHYNVLRRCADQLERILKP